MGSATRYAKMVPPSISRNRPSCDPQAGTVDDIVAQNQSYWYGSDVVSAHDERLREPIWCHLNGIGDRDSELVTVS